MYCIMPPVPGTSGGARAAETLESFFVAEDDSMTVVLGTGVMRGQEVRKKKGNN